MSDGVSCVNESYGEPDVIFEDMGRQYALCLTRNVRLTAKPGAVGAAGEWRRIPFSIANDSEYFRRRLQRARIWELRQLLSRQDAASHSLDENQVLTRIALLLQNGSLELFELGRGRAAGTGAANGGSSPKVDKPQVVFPVADVCPVDLLMNKPPTPPAPTKAAPTVNSAAQAAVLVMAAQQGAPFCELCKQQ